MSGPLDAALEALRSEEEMRLEWMYTITDLVDSAFGEDGRTLGAVLRDSGGMAALAQCLSDVSADIQCQTLLVLGNLCSDAVDSESERSKQLLLTIGAEKALLACLSASEDDVVMLACATLQNLINDPAWAMVTAASHVEPRLEELLSHPDPQMVRYSSGALKNLITTCRSAGGQPPELS